jgi:hypothetical protein
VLGPYDHAFVDDVAFELGTNEAVRVRFISLERPHGDELTFVMVEIRGPGLDARMAVESLSGDHGARADPTASDGDVVSFEDVRLSDFLIDLSTSPRVWDGSRAWRSLADELRVNATCDSLGHVTLTVTLQPRPWKPTWAATATLHYHLGRPQRTRTTTGYLVRPRLRLMTEAIARHLPGEERRSRSTPSGSSVLLVNRFSG